MGRSSWTLGSGSRRQLLPARSRPCESDSAGAPSGPLELRGKYGHDLPPSPDGGSALQSYGPGAMAERLSPLDASFLAVETPTAHMHGGWVALFDPPEGRSQPTFHTFRRHIGSRLPLAPRYRQKLAFVPLGLNDPVWVDDHDFDLTRHVHHSTAHDIDSLVEHVFSTPLDRDRPLWEIWIADKLADGRLGVVGKVHHCMVDGIAAVEFSSLFLEPDPDTTPGDLDEWEPASAPGRATLFAKGVT